MPNAMLGHHQQARRRYRRRHVLDSTMMPAITGEEKSGWSTPTTTESDRGVMHRACSAPVADGTLRCAGEALGVQRYFTPSLGQSFSEDCLDPAIIVNPALEITPPTTSKQSIHLGKHAHAMNPSLQTAAAPSATIQSHASNLLQLPDKTLLCVWFGGSQEGLPDISIWLSRLATGSLTWSEPRKISSDTNRSCQNPVLFRAPKTGDLWLLHTSQDAGNQDGCYIMARTSSDGGETWSEPRFPFRGITGAFVRQPIVVLSDGTWVLPVFHCRSAPGQRWIGNDDVSAVFYSRDDGESWHENAVPDSIGAVHMNIVPPAQGSSQFVAFYRSRWADNIYRSTSSDGLTWSAPEALGLPNPNSGICAARLPSGAIALVFNRSASSPDQARREGLYDDITPQDDVRPNQAAVNGKTAIWGTPRKTLTVGVSTDDGLTWDERVLEEGDGFCMTNNSEHKTNRELSYPSILAEEGAVHIAFTFHRQYIKYARINHVEAWVKG